MYEGEKFTRKQLLFVVETILKAASDRISTVPADSGNDWFYGCIETAGMALAVLHFKIKGKSLGISDALISTRVGGKDFEEATSPGQEHGEGFCRPYAEAFINNCFPDYK